MNNLHFNHTVESIDFDERHQRFVVQTSRAKALPAISALALASNRTCRLA